MNVLIDTGFWFAYYNDRDNNHNKAVSMMPSLMKHSFLIPYPSLYETINTRFAKRKERVNSFKSILMLPSSKLIQDDKYKKEVLQMTWATCLDKNRPMSMVDMIIRQMLDDVNLKSDAIVTFNPGDFYDVCIKRRIIVISEVIGNEIG